MAGVTDLAFRRQAWKFGAGLVVSEMTASNPALDATWKSRARRAHDDEISPRAVQIAGAEPGWMAEAARRAVADGATIVDVNLGCPARKVCRKAAGSALLREPALVRRIVAAVIAAVAVPVTVKMRTGWSPEERNGVEIATQLEQLGVAALTVHGRTRACGYTGPVEYETIRAIRQATSLPLFANGDIVDAASARRVLDLTGADGVYIGRAALGRPWLPGHVAAVLAGESIPIPDAATRWIALQEQVREMHGLYGPARGYRMARKHVGWTLESLHAAPAARRAFNALDAADAQLAWLDALDPEALGPAAPDAGTDAAAPLDDAA